jgi:hypothetical protein
VLAGTFPEVRARLGERWAVVDAAHRAQRPTVCRAAWRALAGWVACGAWFETRQPWAAAILTDAKRGQGAKAYPVVRVLERAHCAAGGAACSREFAQGCASR